MVSGHYKTLTVRPEKVPSLSVVKFGLFDTRSSGSSICPCYTWYVPYRDSAHQKKMHLLIKIGEYECQIDSPTTTVCRLNIWMEKTVYKMS